MRRRRLVPPDALLHLVVRRELAAVDGRKATCDLLVLAPGELDRDALAVGGLLQAREERHGGTAPDNVGEVPQELGEVRLDGVLGAERRDERDDAEPDRDAARHELLDVLGDEGERDGLRQVEDEDDVVEVLGDLAHRAGVARAEQLSRGLDDVSCC